MEITDVVNNIKVFGLEDSIKAAKYPMSVDISSLTSELTPGIRNLGNAKTGSGHDNFLKGIIVQFDLTFTNKAWVEAERYHFLDFVSSQSTMHRITKFNLDEAYIKYVDPRIVDIMKEKVSEYNELQNCSQYWTEERMTRPEIIEAKEDLKHRYLEILYSNPCGFKLTARMTTNYQQLKTIYFQRKDHRLPEWKIFCSFIKTLPMFEELVLGGNCEKT